jgi:hypothetical protein
MKKNKYNYMAECNINSLLVSGAGRTSIDGTYQKSGTEIKGGVTFSIYTKDGNPASLPAIKINFNIGPNLGSWSIQDTIPVFGTESIYSNNDSQPASNIPNCPNDLIYSTVNGPWGGSTYAPAPTITAVIPQPSQDTFGLPADAVALYTSRFGSVANFLRLRNQGQI